MDRLTLSTEKQEFYKNENSKSEITANADLKSKNNPNAKMTKTKIFRKMTFLRYHEKKFFTNEISVQYYPQHAYTIYSFESCEL